MPCKLHLMRLLVHLILMLPYSFWSYRSQLSQTQGKEQSVIPASPLCRSTCKLPLKTCFTIYRLSLFPGSAATQNASSMVAGTVVFRANSCKCENYQRALPCLSVCSWEVMHTYSLHILKTPSQCFMESKVDKYLPSHHTPFLHSASMVVLLISQDSWEV